MGKLNHKAHPGKSEGVVVSQGLAVTRFDWLLIDKSRIGEGASLTVLIQCSDVPVGVAVIKTTVMPVDIFTASDTARNLYLRSVAGMGLTQYPVVLNGVNLARETLQVKQRAHRVETASGCGCGACYGTGNRAFHADKMSAGTAQIVVFGILLSAFGTDFNKISHLRLNFRLWLRPLLM